MAFIKRKNAKRELAKTIEEQITASRLIEKSPDYSARELVVEPPVSLLLPMDDIILLQDLCQLGALYQIKHDLGRIILYTDYPTAVNNIVLVNSGEEYTVDTANREQLCSLRAKLYTIRERIHYTNLAIKNTPTN